MPVLRVLPLQRASQRSAKVNLAGIAGLTGLVLGWAVLVLRLARLESFGVAYLTPFASNAGRQREGHAVFRVPLPWVKLREDYLNVGNRRNQR